MRHRHLDIDAGTAADALGPAAIDDLLERGDLHDWQPLLAAVRRDPWGAVATRVVTLVEQHPMYGTSPLWQTWIADLRAAAPSPRTGDSLRRLRLGRGRTQQAVAKRMGLTQSEISKLERRRDVRLSTLRSYVAALGGTLELAARFDDERVPIEDQAAAAITASTSSP